MTVDAVIFDIGNVLIEWQPERFYDREFGKPARQAMFSQVDLHRMNDRADRGEDFRMVVYETAAAYPAHADLIRLWHDRWLDVSGPEIPGSVALLRALRAKGVPVFALSNFGVQNFAQTEIHYVFLTEFDRRYISGQMKMAKPDPEIYAAVEADCGVAPEHLLFIDDRADNIATAKARGWQTHLFQGPAGLAERLVSEGLLTGKEAELP